MPARPYSQCDALIPPFVAAASAIVPALAVTAALALDGGPFTASDLVLLAAHFWILFLVVLAMPFSAFAIVALPRRKVPSSADACALGAASLFALFWYERLKPLELWTLRYRPAPFDAAALAAVGVLTLLIAACVRGRARPLGVAATRAFVAVAIGSVVLAAYSWMFAPSPARTEPARRLAERRPEGPGPAIQPLSSRVLFIGVDGLDWLAVERLIAKRRLPHIDAIVRGGRSYELDAGGLSFSPEIWTAMYTGVAPRFSGYVTWSFSGVSRPIEALPATGHRPVWGVNKWLWRTTVLRLWTPASLTTARLAGPAFWRVASEAGKTVAVFDPVPYTVIGEEVSGVFAWEEGGSYHAHWKIAERAASTENYPFPGQYRESAAEAMDVDRRRTAIVADLMARTPLALAVYYTSVVDETAHWDWPAADPRSPAPFDERFDRSSLAAAYEQVDRTIGLLRDRFGSPHAVILASDHGWELNAYQHSRVPRGVFVISNGRQSGFGGTMAAEAVAPAVLSLLGLPNRDNRAIAPVFLAPEVNRSDDATRERLKALGYIGR